MQANDNSKKIDVPTYLITKGKEGKVPITPANIKRKKALEGQVISSPTDSFFSPASKMLTRKGASLFTSDQDSVPPSGKD